MKKYSGIPGRILLLEALSSTVLGLLIGVLLGLSVSETVGAIASAFVAAAVTFLGLSSKISGWTTQSRRDQVLRSVRLLPVALFCIVGTGLGLYVRTHNLLGQSIAARKTELTRIGFSEQDALAIIGQQQVSGPSAGKAQISALYGNTQPLSNAGCADADPSRYPNDGDALRAFQAIGGDFAKWALLMQQEADKKDYRMLLKLFWDYSCR